MRNRLELHQMLIQILGSNNVYFQPPESFKLSYPAIVYSRSRIRNDQADDIHYNQPIEYTVTVIDKDPDSEVVMRMARLKYCAHDRHFTSDNLNHDTFTLFF